MKKPVELAPMQIEQVGDGVLDIPITNDRDWFVRFVLTRRRKMFTEPKLKLRREAFFVYWPGHSDGDLIGRVFLPPKNWRSLDVVAHEAVHVGQHVAKLMRKRRQLSKDLTKNGYRGVSMDEEVVAYSTQNIVSAYAKWIGSAGFREFLTEKGSK